jgi:hypothetical protein
MQLPLFGHDRHGQQQHAFCPVFTEQAGYRSVPFSATHPQTSGMLPSRIDFGDFQTCSA